VREDATRAYSPASLRKALDKLVERSLLISGEVGFDCVPMVRQLALRDAAARGALDRLAAMIRMEAHRHLHYSSIGGHEAAWFDFRVALTRRDLHQASTFLAQCAEYDYERFLTQNPLVESVCAPFDPEWLAGFGAHRGALIAWTLDYANRTALPCYGLMPWLLKHAESLIKDVPALRVLLMEAAVLRGNGLVASIPQASELGHTTAAVAFEATQALVQGQYDTALELFERASGAIQGLTNKRSEVSLPRVFVLFHCLALLRRGQAADLARVTRLATSRNRDKGYEYRESALMLKRLSEAAAAPSTPGHSSPPQQASSGTDCLSLLFRGLHSVWFDASTEERAWLLDDLIEAQRGLAQAEYPWLAEEYGQVARKLDESLTKDGWQMRRRRASTLEKLTATASTSNTRPLWKLYEPRPGWLLALQVLEQLVAAPSSQAADDAAQERVVWRIDPANLQIEPVLQKRTGSGWTRGRKIAPKQLLEDGAQHHLLTAADRLVTKHIAEEVESSWGYVNRTHFFKPTALLALVGHPLVFVLPELDVPAELALGEVRLRAETMGDKLVMRVDPPGVSEQPQLVREGQRWVVYALDKQQAAVAKVVGQQLAIPQAGRVQSLDVLGRLAQFFVVHSSEQVEARMVGADSTPWLRMVPSGAGLTVTAAVRPLGEHGPMLSIGHGVPTLIANIQGTPLQTERVLGEETSRFNAVLRACPALALAEVEPFNYALPEPEACLELISQLRDLGDSAHVEWPFGKKFGVRAKLGIKSLRGSIRHDSGWFVASGTLQVDSELNLELQELMALLADGSDRFVKLEGGEYLELEQELRDMVGALRHADQRQSKKQLALPMAALASLEQLTSERLGLKLDPECLQWRQRFDAAFSRTIAIPKGLTAELRDYQAEGFRWLARLAELELGACLADDMGLGKTVEIIALLLHRASQGTALVVAPTSVCDNWRHEIERFAPSLQVRDYSGPARTEALDSLDKRHVVITSYTLLQQDSDSLQAIDWSVVVLDEGQFIKNADTLRAKAACGLRAKVRIIATGTPIENHPNDLFSLFRFLNPHLLGSMQAFQRRFGRATESDDEVAARQRKELRRVIRPFILRRTKAQVLDDLPPLTEIRHTVNLSAAEAQLYEGLRKRAVAKLENSAKSPQSRVQILAELMRLRRVCCHPSLVAPEAGLESAKLASFIELVDELLANQHRALVFSQFVDFLDLTKRLLDSRGIRYQYLDGSTPQKQRSARVEAFQNGEGELFLISLKAGGFGLNLTGADYVIHLDPWWNPATEQQASDRAHRIGQTRPVTVYRLVTAGTIEERIVQLHHRKREVANSLLEGTEGASNISQDELLELLAE
ncbi:MAG TPA: DEAD/DEAH box helicase, partial [Polyangiaceae bacterium]|nr:DEAD/DEAH box helicase [Polyangiaceae bacterium]